MYIFKPHVFTEHSLNSIVNPKGRTDANVRCDGKNLYIYQRDYTHHVEFHYIWAYNLAGQQWRLIRNESISRQLHDDDDSILGTINESNYLVVCSTPFEDEPSSRKCQLHICDLNTEYILVQGASGQIPQPSFALNLINHGKYLYTVGITREVGDFSDVYKLNMENLVWEIVYICQGVDANEPIGRVGHTLVYGNNMIYIFGGDYQGPGQNPFSFLRIPAFDLENCCWKTVNTLGDENHMPHFPTQRGDFAVTSYTDPDSGEENVIISGGTVDYNDAFNEIFNDVCNDALNDVWRLNLTSLKWTCLERFGTVLPQHIENHSMGISPAGKLFTFGGDIFGDDPEKKTRISSLHSTWLRIPTLEDICWEAVFHYYPNLISMTDKEITALGIPPKLLKSRIN
ncbi:kelch domain-containing protein 10 homolog [Microplitis mediator]|uniref:kelch domain-containing protein 10 homolog n=1 Tax=Microplitis mediator TaxID=375433 RepID=UPI002552BA0C|nr:kelch domain-containing protein 10 homolog [Microplitis mediator]